MWASGQGIQVLQIVKQVSLEALSHGSGPRQAIGGTADVMATRDYDAGETVFSMPVDQLITMGHVLESETFGDVAAAIGT